MTAEGRHTGLEYWHAAAPRAGVEPRAVERMLANPAMDAALRRNVRDALAFFGSNTSFNLNFLDHGTYFLGALALYLHISGGLTHRRLAALCGTSRLLSAGRASAILLSLWSKGFLVRGERRGEDRTVRYTPTARMIAAYRERLKIDLESSGVVEPAIAPLMARWDEPGVFEHYLRLAGEDLVHAASNPTPEVDIINKIGAFRAGVLMLYVLMEAADDGGAFPPLGKASTSISALAARFRVSRSHVRRVLRLWEEAGFLLRGDAEGTVHLTPLLHATVKRYFAINFIIGLRYAHAALLALRDSAHEGMSAVSPPAPGAGKTATAAP